MLMDGDVWLGPSERGAFGFSNEKSLMYWASTLSCGSGRSPPLVAVVIEPSARKRLCARLHPARLANIGARHEQGIVGASAGIFGRNAKPGGKATTRAETRTAACGRPAMT